MPPSGARLIEAAKEGDVETLSRLLAEGTPVASADEFKSTALHYASANNHAACVRALLAAGAPVNAQQSAGASPLHWAGA